MKTTPVVCVMCKNMTSKEFGIKYKDENYLCKSCWLNTETKEKLKNLELK